ncbi:hypothetical protein [Archangium violaceum]|uniref:hypothetical protein n=1 Tax=Archangium violaceum TaxID=83451 RepID=UPI001EF5DF67|nr:hypothetical protein [Archangium violaceum]
MPRGWPDFSSGKEALLAPFLSCTSPAEFVALQQRVDMPRLVESLDDWRAVRLGALGPVREDAAHLLQRKRAAFLLTATERYGLFHAEVFALFVLHSAYDGEVDEMLQLLARDKQLGQTLALMPAVHEELEARGLSLSNYPDRAERAADVRRGLGRAARDALSTSLGSDGSRYTELSARRAQLPPPYQQALHEVERALALRHFSAGSVAVGTFDAMTFGVPLGFYYLAAGTGHGAYSLSQGQYEQATRELAPAALMVALCAGGRGSRYLSEARGAPDTPTGAARVRQGLELRLKELTTTAGRLREQLGGEGIQELARYLRADPEAALLVIEGGEAGAAALYEARGNVPKAQAWLSQAKSDRSSSTQTRSRVGKSPEGVTLLADEATGLPREVLDTKLLEVELDVLGPRLSRDVAVLEKQLAALEKTPPAGATDHPLWSDYLEYGRQRVAELERGTKVKHGRTIEPPLKWEDYQKMRRLVTRGLAFERNMAKLLREDAALPRAQRRYLQAFNEPRVETYVGVRKPRSGLRYADVLVIEQKPLPGQPSRVETFSFKSRDFSGLGADTLIARMIADASQALEFYGEALNIRRPGLERHAQVQRVSLIYEGGKLKPKDPRLQQAAVDRARAMTPGVEVLFQ